MYGKTLEKAAFQGLILYKSGKNIEDPIQIEDFDQICIKSHQATSDRLHGRYIDLAKKRAEKSILTIGCFRRMVLTEEMYVI